MMIFEKSSIASHKEVEFEMEQKNVSEKNTPITNELEIKLQEIFLYLKEFYEKEYEDVNTFVHSLLKLVKKQKLVLLILKQLSL
ncbi:MAG: hypothetical protein IPN14_08285 [Bacteroidetes bacterium]|nr:hypothetical protein [Bacteroidota bacterium]